MDNGEFSDLYGMLDAKHKRVAGDHAGFKSLHPGGIITFARHVRSRIEQFEIEVARRAKAAAENARSTEEHVRADFGPEAYDKLEAEYRFGLDFGNTFNTTKTG